MDDHMWDEERAKKLEQLKELVVKIRAACKTNTKEYEGKIERLSINLKNTQEIKEQCDKDAIFMQEKIERLKKENEWLVAKIGHMYCKSQYPGGFGLQTKTELLEEMQQALKKMANRIGERSIFFGRVVNKEG